MNTTTQKVINAVSNRGDCAIWAALNLAIRSRCDYSLIEKHARMMGYSHESGMMACNAVALCSFAVGRKLKKIFNFPNTCRELAVTHPKGKYLIFAKCDDASTHAMALKDGMLYNQNGWGNEPVGFAVKF